MIDLSSIVLYYYRMTIWDASMKLYGWFAEHDSFCLDVDEAKLLEGTKRKKYAKREEQAAIKCALKQLEEIEMISSTIVDAQQVWVLKKSFSSMAQKLELSAETCHSVSLIVNGFCEVVGNKADQCDPKGVKESDIKNLLFVASYLMDNSSIPKPSEEEQGD